MIKYHTKTYPVDIPLRIEEVAAHFDVKKVNTQMNFSLHTEYSYGKRKLNGTSISCFPALVAAQKDGVPQLWKDVQWAEEFAQFILKLVGDHRTPSVIEIHPPFSDYTDLPRFIESYSVFETLIMSMYPETEILLENRCGSLYRGGKFLISKHEDIEELCKYIDSNGLKLKIAYDIPQIYTAHNVSKSNTDIQLLELAKPMRKYIGGVHLWGKRKSPKGRKVAHCGDLNSYFEYNQTKKEMFLSAFTKCFDDGVTRKMVLEINSGNDDLISMITDLRNAGVDFV